MNDIVVGGATVLGGLYVLFLIVVKGCDIASKRWERKHPGENQDEVTLDLKKNHPLGSARNPVVTRKKFW